METTAYIALSRQLVLRRHLEVVANNIANATTSGFKAEAMLLQSALARAGRGQDLAFVQDVATVSDTSPGPLTATGNPFDLAIEGAGYFQFETEAGVRYGRGGQLRPNQDGELVTAAGDPLLDDAGTPIVSRQRPLLTLDVWEHAYYVDYRNKRTEHLEAVVDQLLDWDFAESNFSKTDEPQEAV